jgi:acyl-CoA thioesterase
VFDQIRVRVEIVDSAEADAKRYPVWGDAADLIDVLDVRPDGGGWVSVAREFHCPPPFIVDRMPIEGSQVLAQSIVAAGRHAPGRRAVHASMVFFHSADASKPLRFDIDELSHGRTFTSLATTVSQDGRPFAHGTLLLDAKSDDLIRHSVPAPDVAGPDDAEPFDMWVTGRDLRVVDGAYTEDSNAPVGPPVIDAWIRFHDVPDDPYLHAGLLVQFTGHLSIAAALRPHAGIGEEQAHRTISTGINAITVSLHRDVRADEWMLYHHESTFAGDGMTHSECRVHDEHGELLASFVVDAMVRAFPRGAVVDERSAM